MSILGLFGSKACGTCDGPLKGSTETIEASFVDEETGKEMMIVKTVCADCATVWDNMRREENYVRHKLMSDVEIKGDVGEIYGRSKRAV
jgi:hypothetical protein